MATKISPARLILVAKVVQGTTLARFSAYIDLAELILWGTDFGVTGQLTAELCV